MISSRYTPAICSSPAKILSINHWKVAGAPLNPKGITVNCIKPKGLIKAVVALSSWLIGTCQYPFVRSNVVKYFDLPTVSSILSIRDWICIELGSTVQFPVIHANLIASVFFLNNHNWRCPVTV